MTIRTHPRTERVRKKGPRLKVENTCLITFKYKKAKSYSKIISPNQSNMKDDKLLILKITIIYTKFPRLIHYSQKWISKAFTKYLYTTQNIYKTE